MFPNVYQQCLVKSTMAVGRTLRAPTFWITFLFFYLCFTGLIRSNNYIDLGTTGSASFYTSYGLTLVSFQSYNCQASSTRVSKDDKMLSSRILLFGCKFIVHSTLSIALICLANDVESQPGPLSSSTTNQSLSNLKDLVSKNGLKIVHQNIRGLTTNKDSLSQIIDDYKHLDIISLSETHLQDCQEHLIQIDGYTFLNKSRTTGKGGGVGVYINSNIPFHRRLDLEKDGIECLWIEILFPNSKGILVGSIYRPPNTSKYLSANFESQMESMLCGALSEDKECIVTGDMNCNYLASSDNKDLKALLLSFGLKQLIKDPTRVTQDSKTLIDVFYTNRPQNIYNVIVTPTGISDHDMIGCVRKLHNHKFLPRTISCRNYANYDANLFCKDLQSKDFAGVLNSSCVNDAWSLLKSILKECFEKHAPIIKKKIKGKLCPWLTPAVKNEMNTKDKLLRKARKTNQEIDWSSYKRQRNKVNGMAKRCKAIHYRDLLEENAKSPDKFWSTLKKLYPTKATKEPGLVFVVNEDKITNKTTIANIFCKFFSTVAGSLKRSTFPLCDFVWKRCCAINYMNQRSQEIFDFNNVSERDMFEELKNLKRRKATGLDNFPPGMLKDAARILAGPLAYIINLSLATGSIPSDWKKAKVIPLFKSGSRAEVDNYRPISILPALSKILERVVYKQFMTHLESHGLLSPFQYGFRRKRSTELAVTHLTDAIRREGENGNLTGCVFIDLSKAFDTVSHTGLLTKLPYYGVQDKELAWFTDYLFGRSQVVQYKGVLSDPQPIFSGVPQGSILGPVLFILLFNDIHKPLKHSNIITYADDSVIYTSSNCVDSIQKSLNEDMDSLCTWLKDNELLINVKKGKTETMLFGTSKRIKCQDKELNITANGSTINNVTMYKYLGISLDPSLNLGSHFASIYKKAAGRLNLLRSIRPFIDQRCAKTIYMSMIVPIFTYCGALGLNFSNSRKSLIKNIERRSSIVIGKDQSLPSIENLINRKCCQFVKDCLQNNVCSPFKNYFELSSHTKQTRNNGIAVKLPKVRLEFGKKSFYFQGAKLYNSLPTKIRSTSSRLIFKNKLKDIFI